MIVVFEGNHTYKAYHHPGTGVVDLVASVFDEEGIAAELGAGLSVGLGEDEEFQHLSLDLSGESGDMPVAERPEDAPSAVTAEVELAEGETPRYRFDASAGTLRISFGDLETSSWARVGRSLLWLAIDEESYLAAIVIEGVSKDPKGTAQAAWLEEMADQE
ncbi:MAG: hypothetical protein ACI8QC_003647 [Planctomycetota bacterium]|jgi:hypothetical protein